MASLGTQSAPRDAEEGTLLSRCKDGDRTAWRALYAMHFNFVLRTARSLGTPPSELEDVAQEVFTVAFRKLSQFDHGQFSTWLYRICANVVTDHHRKRRVRSSFAALFGSAQTEEPVAQGPTPEGQVQAAQAQRQVSSILERMSAKKREVFVLFEIEGLSGDEIAERVGCPVDTVWTRLFHARKDFARIGQKLGALEGGGS